MKECGRLHTRVGSFRGWFVLCVDVLSRGGGSLGCRLSAHKSSLGFLNQVEADVCLITHARVDGAQAGVVPLSGITAHFNLHAMTSPYLIMELEAITSEFARTHACRLALLILLVIRKLEIGKDSLAGEEVRYLQRCDRRVSLVQGVYTQRFGGIAPQNSL